MLYLLIYFIGYVAAYTAMKHIIDDVHARFPECPRYIVDVALCLLSLLSWIIPLLMLASVIRRVLKD